MTFGARGGGFGNIGQGPFRTGQGGFGQYLLGDDGANLDALRKQKAQIQWSNGTITDQVYLSELAWYLGRQEKGTSQFLSAQDDLADARYSIGRNRIVNAVNRSASTDDRVANLTRLIRWDQRRLRGSKADNEQSRELRERISDAEAQIRDARYGDEVRRFNDHRRTTEQMLRYARRMAAESRGSPDAQQWQDRIGEWEDRQWDEGFDAAKDAYTKARASTNGDIQGAGDVLERMLQAKLATMGEGTPGRKQYERALRDQRATTNEDVWARRAANMRVALDEGQASDEDYIQFLYQRSNALPKGSTARQQARSEFLAETFRLGEIRIDAGIRSGEMDADAAVDFYQGYLATMQPSAQKYSEIMEKIRGYRIAAVEAVPFTAATANSGGRRIVPSGGTGGIGFVSQYDGSQFAMQNCMFASAAMMVDALGGPNVSGAMLRRYAGDPEGAGFQSDIQEAYESLGLSVDRYNGMGFKKFTKQLEAHGGGAVVIGLLSMLPQEFRISGSGAHAVYVTNTKRVINGETYRLVMDPLGRQGYRGHYWPDSVLQRFAWNGIKNPISGNPIYGSVVFGKKGGRSNVTSRAPGYIPRFQAFDTDRDGNSTVGHGGGTNRQEAGAPTDWRKGRGGKPAGKRGGATTDTDVNAFLDAVGNVEAGIDNGERQLTPADQKNRRDRAADLLIEYKGDVRLAALAWFGRTPDTNTELWDANDRWYANSVATRMGYDKVPPQGIGVIEPGQPIAPKLSGPDVLPGLETVTGAATEVASRRGRPSATDVQPAAGEVAMELAKKLGLPPTETMIRAIIGWMSTDNGNADVDAITGNNPFGIETVGNNDLPGQIGVDQNGRAIFDTMDDGIDAVAAELERNFPDVIAAGRTGDPKKFLTTLDKSSWREGGYGGALVPAYNAQPGEDTITSGGNVLDVPPNLGQMAGQHSDIADLFDIDPRDPAQMGWLNRNIDAAKEAYDKGLDKWMFVPLSGEPVEIGFSPDVLSQLMFTKADYHKVQYDSALSATERSEIWDKQYKPAFNAALATAGSITMDQVDRYVEAAEAGRDDSIRSGNPARAIQASFDILNLVGSVLGVPQGETIDVDAFAGANPVLDGDDLERLRNIVESTDPESPTADKMLIIAQDDRIIVEIGTDGQVVSATIPPEVAFITQLPDGTMDYVYDKTDPNEFIPIVQTNQLADGTFEQEKVPAYVANRVALTLTNPDGSTTVIRQLPGTGQVAAAMFDYADYRPPVQPVAPTQGGGGIFDEGTMLGNVIAAPGAILGTIGNIFGPSPVSGAQPEQAATPAPTAEAPYVRQPWDAVRRTVTSQLDVQRVTYIDPISKLTMDAYSHDEGATWFVEERQEMSGAPPMLVLNPDSNIKAIQTPTGLVFVIPGDNTPYTADTLPGGIAGNFGWYDSAVHDPSPYAVPGKGAPNRAGGQIVTSIPTPGGGTAIPLGTPLSRRAAAYESSANIGSAALSRSMREHDFNVVDKVLAAGGGKAEATAALESSYTSTTAGYVPPVSPIHSGMSWLTGHRTGATAASANANQVSAKAMAARAVLAAQERTAAITRRNAAVARQRTAPSATPRATPTPTPAGGRAIQTVPRRSPKPTGFTPRPTPQPTGAQAGAIIGGGSSTLARPKPSASPGPRRE